MHMVIELNIGQFVITFIDLILEFVNIGADIEIQYLIMGIENIEHHLDYVEIYDQLNRHLFVI